MLVGDVVPLWVIAIAWMRTLEDIGPGDTVARLTLSMGISTVLATFGVPCKCEERRAQWNADYPYGELSRVLPR